MKNIHGYSPITKIMNLPISKIGDSNDLNKMSNYS
jgi:hypothetical protein